MKIMASPEYEAIFVHKKTKKAIKLRCVQEEKTFDQLLQELVEKK